MPQIPAYASVGAILARDAGPQASAGGKFGGSPHPLCAPRRAGRTMLLRAPGGNFRWASPLESQQALLAWEAARMVGLSVRGEAVECNLRPWHPIPIIARSQVSFYFCPLELDGFAFFGAQMLSTS